MPCFPIPTAHLFQRKRRVWFKEQATLRSKVGGSKGVATAIPVTDAPRRQSNKTAAKHRVAKHNVRRDLVMSREGAFSSFCRLTKRGRAEARNTIPPPLRGTSLCTREALEHLIRRGKCRATFPSATSLRLACIGYF